MAASSLLCPEGTCDACGAAAQNQPQSSCSMLPMQQPLGQHPAPALQLLGVMLGTHHPKGMQPRTPGVVPGATRLFGTGEDECPRASQAATAGMAQQAALTLTWKSPTLQPGRKRFAQPHLAHAKVKQRWAFGPCC